MMNRTQARKLVYKMIKDLEEKKDRGSLNDGQFDVLRRALFNCIPDLDKEEPQFDGYANRG